MFMSSAGPEDKIFHLKVLHELTMKVRQRQLKMCEVLRFFFAKKDNNSFAGSMR